MAAAIQPVARTLAAAAERYGTRVSWTRAEGWHVTLKFLGEIDEGRLDGVSEAVARVAAGSPPLELQASGLGTLPPRGTPRVLVVRISGGDGLLHVAGALDRELASAGFAPEQRPFVGHLTIGRVRDARGWTAWRDQVERRCATSFGGWTAQEIVVYRSELGKGPARYRPLASFPMGSGGGAVCH